MLTHIGKAFLQSHPRAFAASRTLSAGFSICKSDDKVRSETQHNLWSSYLQTGDGSVDLFSSINQKSDGRFSKPEVSFFLSHASQDCEVSPKMLENLNGLADDHPITLTDFHQWLVDATKKDDAVNSNFRWNAGNMNQKLREMQYAVRGGVAIGRLPTLLFQKRLGNTGTACRQYHELSYRKTGIPQEQLFYHEQTNLIPNPPADTSVDWVLVQLIAAPCNPADLNVVEGKYPLPHGKNHHGSLLPDSYSYVDPECKVAGAEGLGRVLHVHKNLPEGAAHAPNFSTDEIVVLAESGWGTWRSHLWVPAQSLLRLPKEIMERAQEENGLSIPQVSLISQVAGTAYRLIKDFASIQPGDVILQNAGTSAVSMCVAELMRIRYPESHLVSFVRRSDKGEDWPELVNLLTQDSTTNHTIASEDTALTAVSDKDSWRKWREEYIPGDGKVVLGLNSVHGPQTSRLFFPLLSDSSSLVTYGAMSKQSLPVPAAPLIFRNISVCGYWHSRWMISNRLPVADNPVCPRQEMLDDLCKAVLENNLVLPSVMCVDLSEADQDLETIFHGSHERLVKPKLVWNLET